MRQTERIHRIGADVLKYILARVANHELGPDETMTIATITFVDVAAFCCVAYPDVVPSSAHFAALIGEALEDHLPDRVEAMRVMLKDMPDDE